MPLELVREVDKAVEAIVLATRESPDDRTPEKQETLYWQADLRVRQLSVSPIFLALHFRFVELAGHWATTSWTFWVSLFLNISIIPLAIKQIPLASPSMTSMIQLAAFNNTFQSTISNTGFLVWIDAYCTPIFHYLLDDISDREQLHYTAIGVLLALTYESTLFLLHATGDSIVVILLTAIGMFVGVQLVLTLLVSRYIKYASRGLFGRSNTSSLVGIFTLGAQNTLFQAGNLAKRAFAPLSRRPKELRPVSPLRFSLEANLHSPYSWLPPGYFRLLRIPKRQPSESRIHCQFIVVPLASAPPYEAVSYVWGSPTKDKFISVNNTDLAITSSAYEIIQRRHSFWRERVIWIDQICINQRDVNEKAKQVQMMRDIYTRAERVTAWLGNSPHAQLVQRFFAELDMLNRSPNFSSGQKLKEKIFSMHEERRSHLSAVSEFFRNPWFRRVWIIQEAACAKRLYVMYGDVCMDWVYLCRAVAVLLSQDLLTIFPRSDADGKILSFTDNMNRRLGLRNADTMMAFRGDINYGKPSTLSWLLDEAMGFESTDPRDMVYALLGLTADDSSAAIIPKYDGTNSPASVYTQVMRFLFSQATPKPPAALYKAGVGWPRSGKVPGLPSWVPDWSYSTQIRFLHDDYAAGTSYSFKVGDLDDHEPSITRLQGEIVDHVKHLGHIFSAKDGNTRLDEVIQLQQSYDEAYDLASTHAFQASDESLFNETFIRTLLGNKRYGGPDGKAFFHGLSASQCQGYFTDMKQGYEKYRMLTALEEEPGAGTETELQLFLEFHTRVEEFGFLLGSSIGGRRFCVTKKGRMAVVPPLCKKDDLVVILGGMSMPFLLREHHGQSATQTSRTSTQGSDSARYKVVGCCYVDSAMEGEIELGKGGMFTLV
ncbi:Heterokaryon incompatibility protein (HET) domain containing protein [Rhypophila sp. PSN 637]